MLYQLFKQNRRTNEVDKVFTAQADEDHIKDVGGVHEWIKDVHSRHPLAEDEMWMMCDETSPYFNWTTQEETQVD